MSASRWQQMGEGFWNLRGSFRVGGLVEIGTHLSLVRLQDQRWAFLDAYSLDDEQIAAAEQIAGGHDRIVAVVNLHPFHTVHVRAMHQAFPRAQLYGTERHRQRFADLPWADECTEQSALHRRFAADLVFTVPRGVDFISANEQVHFSSVLALHRDSAAIHVDDTLMCLRMPLPLRWLGIRELVSFHPSLGFALQKRAGAAAEFREWAEDLAEDWGHARHLCAAHNSGLSAAAAGPGGLRPLLQRALQKMNGTLKRHQRSWG